MKKIFVSLFVSLFLLSTVSSILIQAQTPKPKQLPQNNPAAKAVGVPDDIKSPFVSKVLPNGLEVIVLPDASVPLVTVEMAVRNGSFTEPPELNGLSHLFEHMFFKPNRAALVFRCEQAMQQGPLNEVGNRVCAEPLRLKNTIGDVSYFGKINNMGINYNGRTQEEVVEYYFTTTSPYLSTAMKYINDSIRYPTFDPEEFEQEKKVVIGEIDRNEANPYFYLNRALNDKLFYQYPTRKNPLGTRETVSTATTEKMQTIQSRYYVPNNSALVITGDVKPDEVFKMAESVLGSWEKRAVDPFKDFPLVNHPPLKKSEGLILDKQTGEEGAQTREDNVFIQVGWQGPSIGKDNAATYTADVFSYILSQPNSRFQRTMVDSGLVSAADIGYYTQKNVGPIQLSLVTTPEKSKAAIKTAYAEIAQFDQPGYFTDEELASAKTILESRDLFDREKLSDYAHTLSFWWSSTGIDYFRGYYKNLRAVTRADVNRYVKTYIQNKPHVGIALVSPDAKTKSKLTEQDLIGK